MSEMGTNKLLKKAVRNTYKKLTGIPKQHPKNTSNFPKTSNKVDKTVKLADKPNKDSKAANKTPKSETVKTRNIMAFSYYKFCFRSKHI